MYRSTHQPIFSGHQPFVSSAAHKCTQPSLTSPVEFSPIRVLLSVFGLFRDWSTIIISSVFELAAAADQHVEELIVKRVGAAAVATYPA